MLFFCGNFLFSSLFFANSIFFGLIFGGEFIKSVIWASLLLPFFVSQVSTIFLICKNYIPAFLNKNSYKERECENIFILNKKKYEKKTPLNKDNNFKVLQTTFIDDIYKIDDRNIFFKNAFFRISLSKNKYSESNYVEYMEKLKKNFGFFEDKFIFGNKNYFIWSQELSIENKKYDSEKLKNEIVFKIKNFSDDYFESENYYKFYACGFGASVLIDAINKVYKEAECDCLLKKKLERINFLIYFIASFFKNDEFIDLIKILKINNKNKLIFVSSPGDFIFDGVGIKNIARRGNFVKKKEKKTILDDGNIESRKAKYLLNNNINPNKIFEIFESKKYFELRKQVVFISLLKKDGEKFSEIRNKCLKFYFLKLQKEFNFENSIFFNWNDLFGKVNLIYVDEEIEVLDSCKELDSYKDYFFKFKDMSVQGPSFFDKYLKKVLYLI
jgi:hypothetical protein